MGVRLVIAKKKSGELQVCLDLRGANKAVILYYYFYPFFVLSCIIAKPPIRARERRRLKVLRPPIHNQTKPHCFLTQRASNPEANRTNVSEETPCTWQPWLARTAPSPPQESLVRDDTRISLPAKPSLTRTTLGQLCVAPRTSRSWPVTTEPGREPRVSGGAAGAAVQRPQSVLF